MLVVTLGVNGFGSVAKDFKGFGYAPLGRH
jgi:hypothetical protein